MRLFLRCLVMSAIVLAFGGCSMYNREVYRGDSQNGAPHGQGWKSMPNGEKYVGEWREGKMSGSGVYTWPSGQRYEGEYSNGLQHGQGTMSYANGDRYAGTWHDGMKSGHGLMTFANRDSYDGNWQDDIRSGQGIMLFANKNRYNGIWGNNEFAGRGTLDLNNGNAYVGNFTAGRREGDGAALAYYDPKDGSWCMEDCANVAAQFAIVSGAFSAAAENQSLMVKPCGTDQGACRKKVEPAVVALAQLRARQEADRIAEQNRIEAAKVAEQNRIEAARVAELKRIEDAKKAELKRIADEKQRVIDERNKFLATASAAELYMDADGLETNKDYVKSAEVYRIVVKRFPDSAFAAQAMGRLAAMRDKRDQQEAEEKRAAADEKRRAEEAELRRSDNEARRAEAEARRAEANRPVPAQGGSGGGAGRSLACIACDQLDGFAKMACKAATCN